MLSPAILSPFPNSIDTLDLGYRLQLYYDSVSAIYRNGNVHSHQLTKLSNKRLLYIALRNGAAATLLHAHVISLPRFTVQMRCWAGAKGNAVPPYGYAMRL